MKHIAKGMGVSHGKVKGKVKIIESLDDHDNFEEGAILVTHLTDPAMVVLMNQARAIVCNIGGLTSHPSILSRELGIPCIVSAKCVDTGKNITEILEDGQEIQVDGEEVAMADVLQDLRVRDEVDVKQWQPLLSPGRAVIIDTTELTMTEVVDRMTAVLEQIH